MSLRIMTNGGLLSLGLQEIGSGGGDNYSSRNC